MKKFLLALFALALVVAFTAPAYAAADFRFSGFFRMRGVTSDNEDRNEDAGSGKQYFDALTRPRFTAKTNGGKIMALYELDWTSANNGFDLTGRHAVGTNRWVVDFVIPGSAFRFRWGRTDYVSPDKEIFDSSGRSRNAGYAVYGKIANNLSLSAFNTVRRNDKTDASDDADNYLVALGWKAAPNITLSPWIANSRDSSASGYDMWYTALTAKAKVGIVSINATGVFQNGDVAKDIDLSAWGFLLRTTFGLGKLKLMANATMLTGEDSNYVLPAGTERNDVGHQSMLADKELNRFTFPSLGGVGWVFGPHIMTSRRWTTTGNSVRNVTLSGNGRTTQLNGAAMIEGLFEYKVSKTFTIGGGLSFIQSAEAVSKVCWDGVAAGDDMEGVAVDGDCHANEKVDDDDLYDDSKDFGTEFNLGFKWKLYPNLELRTVAAYLFAGDYGKKMGDKDFDDTWVVAWTMRHTF